MDVRLNVHSESSNLSLRCCVQHHGHALLRGELRRRLGAGVGGGAPVPVQQPPGLLVRVPHRVVQAVPDGAGKGSFVPINGFKKITIIFEMHSTKVGISSQIENRSSMLT